MTATTPERPTHVWVFDINRRVYPEGGGIGRSPIYREHWRKVAVTGQTSRS